MDEKKLKQDYTRLAEKLAQRQVDAEAVKTKVMQLAIETPSWGYGDSGTRFKVFTQPGVARNAYEKIQDAAMVHKVTGIAPTVAIHIPWDWVDDFTALKQHAEKLGVKIGSVNPNLFQDEDYKYGSVTHVDPIVRSKAVDHILECIQIAEVVNSKVLSLWLADGSDYPGQVHFRQRKQRLLESLQKVYKNLPQDMCLLVEYKLFEPAFYHTDLADWGITYIITKKLGERAKVLVDMGHHAQGTNVEWIVAMLIDEGKLGGFHFNNRKYADDDLTVGAINPYEIFLIFNELIDAESDPDVDLDVSYMLDQSHNTKLKIEATIQSVMFVQETYAKALTVDRKKLAKARAENDAVTAELALQEAFNTDVTPLLQMARIEKGLEPDPLVAYKNSGYFEKICEARGAGAGKGWE
ncbi:L-rhamnose isomerase [candidate division KSB1 bacterium]|nr:MAG: L-rhamnose isomerase [candidate division KSB1 bacterium]